MRSLYHVALLSTFALAEPIEVQKRQATNGAQFSSAANQLISSYVGPGAFAPLAPAIQSAASAASVSYSDIQSLVYSALEADPVPAWFTSAIPSAYQSNIAALESGISALRGAAIAPTAIVPVVIAITTTDSAGSTFTTSVSTSATGSVATSTATISSGTALATSTATAETVTTSTTTTPQSTSFTTFTNSAGSVITSGILVGVNGASSVGSQAVSGASSVGSQAVSGASSVGTAAITGINSAGSVAVSGASSVGSQGVSGASSVISAASSFFAPPTTTGSATAASTSSSRAAGAVATAGAAVGGLVLGALGLIIAL